MGKQAKFYPVGGSRCLPVSLNYQADSTWLSLIEQQGNQLLSAELLEFTISDKLGSLPLELILPDVGMLVVDNDADFEWWLKQHTGGHRLARLETNRKLILLSVLLVPAVLFSLFKFAIPYCAIVFANYVPAPAVEIASRHTLIALDRSLLNTSQLEPQSQLALQQAWTNLLSKLQLNDHNYQLQFRQSKAMGANAFALPNGTVVVTDELVNLLEQDMQLLSAILLHEIGHVQHKHSMRLIAQTLATSLTLHYFFGDLGALIEGFGSISSTLAQNQFSQKLEWQADNYAIEKLALLGQDPEAFALAMEKLASSVPELSKLDSLLSSHPIIAERIDNARQRLSNQ